MNLLGGTLNLLVIKLSFLSLRRDWCTALFLLVKGVAR